MIRFQKSDPHFSNVTCENNFGKNYSKIIEHAPKTFLIFCKWYVQSTRDNFRQMVFQGHFCVPQGKKTGGFACSWRAKENG